MSPIRQAQAVCQKIGTTFEGDLALYLEHGYVVSAPDRLMLFKAARTENPALWLKDPAEANAWFVYLAVGKVAGAVRWFFHQQPWTLPYLIWTRAGRDNRPHIYSTAAFYKHI